ncbi:MAG: hypothetical protein J6R61_05215 [Bacteroidales bacterium]|nr:hypothetical protein [Bacteroidales bacterium]
MQNFKCVTLLFFIILLCSCSSFRMGKEESSISAEQSFMLTNFKRDSIKDWEQGMEFVCVLDELPILLEPRSGIKEDYKNLKGTKFKYKGLEETQTWRGFETCIVYESNGVEFVYKISKQITEILSTDFNPLLPELVSCDYILFADSLLRGKTLYIKTPNWYSVNGVEESGKKLIPVIIQKIEAGNKIFPLSIIFKTSEGREAMVYTTMFASQYMSQYSTFDKLFTFSNPKDKYPQIKEEVWQLITQSKVALGMTKDECQISIGLPDGVSQIPEYSGLRERWTYNTGSYLEFKDGLLVKFRLI